MNTIKASINVSKTASAIAKSWAKTIDALFETGDLIAKAKRELTKDELRMLIPLLPFSERTAARLCSIAGDKRLRSKKMQKKLPSCWSTLYEMSRLSDDEFQDGIARGFISETATREQIVALKGKATTTNKGGKKRWVPAITIEVLEGEVDELTNLDIGYLQNLITTQFCNNGVISYKMHSYRSAAKTPDLEVFDRICRAAVANRKILEKILKVAEEQMAIRQKEKSTYDIEPSFIPLPDKKNPRIPIFDRLVEARLKNLNCPISRDEALANPATVAEALNVQIPVGKDKVS